VHDHIETLAKMFKGVRRASDATPLAHHYVHENAGYVRQLMPSEAEDHSHDRSHESLKIVVRMLDGLFDTMDQQLTTTERTRLGSLSHELHAFFAAITGFNGLQTTIANMQANASMLVVHHASLINMQLRLATARAAVLAQGSRVKGMVHYLTQSAQWLTGPIKGTFEVLRQQIVEAVNATEAHVSKYIDLHNGAVQSAEARYRTTNPWPVLGKTYTDAAGIRRKLGRKQEEP
jgi:hypothetical protein